MRRKYLLCSVALAVGIICTSRRAGQTANPSVKGKTFGKMANGQVIELYTLTNRTGVEVAITSYGGRVVSILVPDRLGKVADVVLGFDTLDGYLKDNPYFGALVGRYANRIAGARFALDGLDYRLAQNDGSNSLHGA
jgi:aldose 1-epimerase